MADDKQISKHKTEQEQARKEDREMKKYQIKILKFWIPFKPEITKISQNFLDNKICSQIN
jgi:hypothetical protein